MPRPEAADLWRERLRRFDRSRMTVVQFCASEGVSQPSFYQWKKKLRQLPDESKPEPTAAVAQFIPLHLPADPDRHVGPEAGEHGKPALASTTIELPGGVRIRVEVPASWQPGERPEART